MTAALAIVLVALISVGVAILAASALAVPGPVRTADGYEVL